MWRYVMKKLWYISTLLIPLIILTLFTGCPSKDGGEEVYYIRATLNGTTYEWIYGRTDIEPNAFGSFHPAGTIGTEMLAQPTETSSTEPEPDDFVHFYIRSSSTSPASYTFSDFKYKYFRLSGITWEFTAITLEITKYDPVGGTIEGTFSGTIQEYLGTATMTVTNGQFIVKRAIDDAWQ
jgi:hypothetical protein